MFNRKPRPDDLPDGFQPIDASRYIMETKREAVSTIVPHPDEKEERIDLITLLSGRKPDMYRLLLANVEQEGWIALSKGQVPRLDSIEAIKYLMHHSPSLDGFRSKQVVEIAKSESVQAGRSILDMLKGRK